MSEVKNPKLLFPASPGTVSNESLSHDGTERAAGQDSQLQVLSFHRKDFYWCRFRGCWGGWRSSRCSANSISGPVPALRDRGSRTLYSFMACPKFGPNPNLPFPPAKSKAPCSWSSQNPFPRAKKSLEVKKLQKSVSIKAFRALVRFLQVQQSFKRKVPEFHGQKTPLPALEEAKYGR